MSAATDNFDVIIIGGGTIGQTLAAMLQALPLRIAIVEAKPLSNTHSPFAQRPIALSHASQVIFSTLGWWQDIAAAAMPISTIHVSERGQFGSTVVHAAEQGVPALGYVSAAYHIENVISNKAASLTNVTWLRPATLGSAELHDSQWQVSVASETGSRTLHAPLLIGADGRQSSLRQCLHIDVISKDYDQVALITTVGLQRPHEQIAYERFTAQGPMGLLPMCAQRAGLVWSMTPAQAEQFCQLDETQFLKQLQETFGYRSGRFTQAGPRLTFPLSLVAAEQVAQRGAILVGDAAQGLHPVAGQGLNLGMRDIAILAELIRDHCRAHEHLCVDALWQEYAQARANDRQRTMLFSDFVSRIFVPQLKGLSLLRDMGLCAIDLIPPFKRRFVRQNMGMMSSMPELMRGVPLE